MLEKANAVGSSWRGHYHRLHLHTVKALSALPNLPFPDNYPRYVPRRSMVDYLDNYAATFDLKPRFATPVHSIRRDDEGWVVEAASGPIEASHVVIASGLNAAKSSLKRSGSGWLSVRNSSLTAPRASAAAQSSGRMSPFGDA